MGTGATLNLASANPKTYTLSTSTGTTLTLQNGAILTFGVGATSTDEIVVNPSALALVTGTITINITTEGGGPGTYVLISSPGGGLLNTNGSTATYVLGTTPSGSTDSLVVTDTSVSLVYSALASAFWKGGLSNNWSDGSGFGNFTSDAGGVNPLTSAPTGSTDIIFSASGDANSANTVLGGAITVKSLTINDPTVATIGAVTDLLTLAGVGGSTGITSGATAGPVNIITNVTFSGTSTVEVDGANALTISGTIGGGNGLTKNGVGELILTGTNNYTGSTFVNAGTLNFNSDLTLGSSADPVVFNGGTMQMATSVGTIASARAFTLGTGTSTFDTNGAGNKFVTSGIFSGAGGFNLVGGGVLAITGSNINTGTIQVSSGTFQVGNGGSTGALSNTGTFVANSGGVLSYDLTGSNSVGQVIAGSGTLMQSGPSTSNLALTGSESISNYVVNSGTLTFANNRHILRRCRELQPARSLLIRERQSLFLRMMRSVVVPQLPLRLSQ